MIKHEIKACTKCKKKIFLSLLDEKGELVITQFIGLKKIGETKGPVTESKFVCGLCDKSQQAKIKPKLSLKPKKKK